jgi:2-polyprenyl-3-methyl-5-hydroxy-6-metoxy-1,4-benzoquinol methylase
MNKNISQMLKSYKPNTLYWYNRLKFFLFPFIKLEMLVPKNGFIIDLGCSHGLLANYLALRSETRDVLGVEMNENRIKFANIGIKNTKFKAGDITKIDIPQADCIIFTHVLHHLFTYEEQERLLKFCYQKLKSNGTLIICEVGRSPKWKYIVSLVADKMLYPFEKINFIAFENLKNLLKQMNLAIEIVPMHRGTVFSHYTFIGKKN